MNTQLSYMQEMTIRDRNGNCRCPYCGKYRKRSDFERQAGHVDLSDRGGAIRVHLHVAPACRYCLEEECK